MNLQPSPGLIAALRASQDNLATTLSGVDDDLATQPSYDDGCSIADVASHLGSSAVPFTGYLLSGRDGTPASGQDAAQPVWDEWNAKAPAPRCATRSPPTPHSSPRWTL
ncbi:MAG: hypothetical protein WAV00_24020 [Nocardioides sp.]